MLPQEKTLESIYEQWQPVAFELKPWKAMPWAQSLFYPLGMENIAMEKIQKNINNRYIINVYHLFLCAIYTTANCFSNHQRENPNLFKIIRYIVL